MLITISGLPGSGKTTIAKLLAKRFHIPYVSIGGLRRQMAKERGMTLEQFNTLGEKNRFTDRDVDAWQAQEARKLGRGVFEGRVSFHFIPRSFKIFLGVDFSTAAKRIWSDPKSIRRFEGSFRTVRQLETSLRQRVASDTKRYRRYYRMNIFDHDHYDLVLDTAKHKPSEILKKVIAEITDFYAGGDKKVHNRKLSTTTGSGRQGKAKRKKLST